MAFCESSDILTNINMATADVPSTLMAKAIIKGDAEIRAAFSTELLAAIDAADPLPAIIKSLAEDIASYFVMRGLYAGNDGSINDWIDRYRSARATLKAIADGTMQIEGIDIDNSSDMGSLLSSTKDYKSTFDERDETDWGVDYDKIDDLDSEADG